MTRTLVFFWLFVTWVGANHLRHRHLMINEEEPLVSHLMLHHPDNTLALRNHLTSTGEQCTLCWEAMEAADVDKIVACSKSKGKHGFHFDCLKNNIHLRHTKCPLCGDGVQLPVSESDLRTIYLNRFGELMKTIEHYSTFEIGHATDVLKDPIESDMTMLFQNMKFTSEQVDFLEEHLPTELNDLDFAFQAMLHSFELKFRHLYYENTHTSFIALYQGYTEKRMTLVDVQMHLRSNLKTTLEEYSRTQWLWWHDLNVAWLGKVYLDTYTFVFRVQVPSKATLQKLLLLCDTFRDAITNDVLLKVTYIYEKFKKILPAFNKECEAWKQLIPVDFQTTIYLDTAYGQFCDLTSALHDQLHGKLPHFTQQVLERYQNTNESFKNPRKRSTRANKSCATNCAPEEEKALDLSNVAAFMESLPREESPAFQSLYDAFQKLVLSTKKLKPEGDDFNLVGLSKHRSE